MKRWRILFLSLGFTAVVLAARLAVHEVAGFRTNVLWSDIQVVVTGASLIIGLMLAGVLREYGDASLLPGAVAASLSAFDRLIRNAAAVAGIHPGAYLGAIEGLTDAITEWLYGRAPDAVLRSKIDAIRKMLADLQRNGASEAHVMRGYAELATIDTSVARMMSLRNGSYLQSGYTLMYVLATIVLVLLLFVDFENSGLAPWLISGSLTLIYAYLITLIRDLDNPFQYGRNAGVAEVDLAPLLAVSEDIHART